MDLRLFDANGKSDVLMLMNPRGIPIRTKITKKQTNPRFWKELSLCAWIFFPVRCWELPEAPISTILRSIEPPPGGIYWESPIDWTQQFDAESNFKSLHIELHRFCQCFALNKKRSPSSRKDVLHSTWRYVALVDKNIIFNKRWNAFTLQRWSLNFKDDLPKKNKSSSQTLTYKVWQPCFFWVVFSSPTGHPRRPVSPKKPASELAILGAATKAGAEK